MKEHVSFSINCFVCNETFNIFLRNLTNKNKLECPNCGQMMDNKVLEKIKDSIKQLEDALKLLYLSNKPDKGWSFSLAWDDENKIPKKPNELNFLTINYHNKDYSPF